MDIKALNYMNLPTEEKLKREFERFEDFIRHSLELKEIAFERRWVLSNSNKLMTPEEADIFIDEISTWVIDGVKLSDLEVTRNDQNRIEDIKFNLVKVE